MYIKFKICESTRKNATTIRLIIFPLDVPLNFKTYFHFLNKYLFFMSHICIDLFIIAFPFLVRSQLRIGGLVHILLSVSFVQHSEIVQCPGQSQNAFQQPLGHLNILIFSLFNLIHQVIKCFSLQVAPCWLCAKCYLVLLALLVEVPRGFSFDPLFSISHVLWYPQLFEPGSGHLPLML